ncbi:MAG: dihydropteroate synthase [Candidatus Bathyarchaeia archaeon]
MTTNVTEMRKLHADLAGLEVGDGLPVRIVGAINVSPESFYKGSVRILAEEIAERARSMVEGGADIIDIGAMSTAPYLETEISVEEEVKRVVRAIEAVKGAVNVPVSIDSKRCKPVEAAIEAGADIVNDVSGLKFDHNMPEMVANHDAPVILVASNLPSEGDPIDRTVVALRESMEICETAGIDVGKTVIDPGIGFHRETSWKWYDWDCFVIRNLSRLRVLDRPICLGVSRKSFIGEILSQSDPSERLFGSLSATAISVLNGAHAIRTHDVKPTIEATRLAEYIRDQQLSS